MRNWQLPESIADSLPREAQAIERLRRALLDRFARHGFQLVMPPLAEHLDALLAAGGDDLRLRTFKLVDQMTGRSLGVRADHTPQVARIDAHMLNQTGVTRLCYCGPVLHTRAAALTATREPLQLGAEIYGHASLEADIEILRLLGQVLAEAGVSASRIDVGHVGVFRALIADAALDKSCQEALLDLLKAKDLPGLSQAVKELPGSVATSLMVLPSLYGGVDVLARARAQLPCSPALENALVVLEKLAEALPDLPLSFDLADLRGYHYHTGIVFAAYGNQRPTALALGGRYDDVGQSFGRARPATGFSLDLREIVEPAVSEAENLDAIAAPFGNDSTLLAHIAELRAHGETVIEYYPGQEASVRDLGCGRQLVKAGREWRLAPLQD